MYSIHIYEGGRPKNFFLFFLFATPWLPSLYKAMKIMNLIKISFFDDYPSKSVAGTKMKNI